MFKIYDGREYFYQWDLDRKLIVYDETIKEVHFCNKTDDCSLVCEVYAEGELRLVNVPNILLQDNWRINVYGYDENYTKISKQFDVKSRTKPADYTYTETEVKQWEDLEERISAISEELKNYNEVLGYIEGEVGGSIPQVETAKEGQILSIKQVSPTGYPTEWEAVDLPNSTGATTGSGEDIYYVKMAFVEGLYYSPDKSYEEIVEAFESGKDVRCKINIEDYPLNLPLLAVMKGEKIIVYGGIVAGIAISVVQTTTIANALYDNVLTMDHLDSTVVSQAAYSTYTAQNDTNYSKLNSTVADINNQIGKTVPKVGSLLLNGEEGQVVALIKKDVVNPEWGLIDLPSGGKEWELYDTITVSEDVGEVVIGNITDATSLYAKGYKELYISYSINPHATTPMTDLRIQVNSTSGGTYAAFPNYAPATGKVVNGFLHISIMPMMRHSVILAHQKGVYAAAGIIKAAPYDNRATGLYDKISIVEVVSYVGTGSTFTIYGR